MTESQGHDAGEDFVTDATREVEQDEADHAHVPGDDPTAAEEHAAERSAPASEDVGEHYEEMIEKGADVKGEGEVP